MKPEIYADESLILCRELSFSLRKKVKRCRLFSISLPERVIGEVTFKLIKCKGDNLLH